MIIQAELKCKQTGCEADPCAVDTAAVEIHLEVPVRFLGHLLPAAEMTLHTEAKYVPVF